MQIGVVGWKDSVFLAHCFWFGPTYRAIVTTISELFLPHRPSMSIDECAQHFKINFYVCVGNLVRLQIFNFPFDAVTLSSRIGLSLRFKSKPVKEYM